jgi:hypothetical protein
MSKKSKIHPTFSIRPLARAYEIIIEPSELAPGDRIRPFRTKQAAEGWIKAKSKKWFSKHSKRVTG